MKAVILAGGFGTRLAEETDLRPKPMVEVGGKPILWHIMKIYSAHGVDDFIICCGYRGYVIKEYFANYFLHQSDVTWSMKNNTMQVHQNNVEPWTVTLVDTGEHTGTGGRLRRIRNFINPDEHFCFTYGDGVGDVDITALISFHLDHGKLATLTATRPPGRFGAINFGVGNAVTNFQEKVEGDGSWINGGYFVLHSDVFELIDGDQSSWENGPLVTLADSNELHAYKHHGFWQPMDTLREKNLLNNLWASGSAPWKCW